LISLLNRGYIYIKKATIYLSVFLIFISCFDSTKNQNPTQQKVNISILGTVQDGGIPHLGCEKSCCKDSFERGFSNKRVVSLGISDLKENKNYLIEASPDISYQLNDFLKNGKKNLHGIFITHAHIGHYSGLINFGKEVLNSSKMPLYLMPKMTEFISSNGPWSQLVEQKNVELKKIFNEKEEKLTNDLSIIPLRVPHRDEYSETVGFKIIGPKKSVLFIPDIDKWEKWDKSIKKLITQVDYAFLDGTFYDAQEINNRDISEIPHPFIIESLKLFEDLNKLNRNKIYFIHLNHTNPANNKKSKAYKLIISKGLNVAQEGSNFEL